jgi:translation initiation factor IF-2
LQTDLHLLNGNFAFTDIGETPMSITKVKGQALNLAKMRIANHCQQIEEVNGSVNVRNVVTNINDMFKLVPKEQAAALAQDVEAMHTALQKQQVDEINRGGYWKMCATHTATSLKALEAELKELMT